MTQNDSRNIQDILSILNDIVLPDLSTLKIDVSGLKSDVSGLKKDFRVMSDRQDRMDKKLDLVVDKVLLNEKSTDKRVRVVERKLGVYHD